MHGVGVPGSDLSTRFIYALGRALSKLGLRLWIEHFSTREEFVEECNEELLRKVDGLLVSGLNHPEFLDQLHLIRKRGLPVVAVWEMRNPEVEGIPNFNVDMRAQAYLPTQHLIEQGCRRIAHFKTAPDRYSGYRLAIEEADCSVDPELCIPIPHFTVEAGRMGMRALLEKGINYDGICAQSDAQAAGALIELVYAGVPMERWPKITGVDDSPIGRDFSLVPLTSSTAEMKKIAERSIKAIAQAIDGKKITGEILPPELVVRASTTS